jgi:5-methylcytosine-specific restriction endonuclease McrA
MPLSLGGVDNLENLALACSHCNRRKTNRLTVVNEKSVKKLFLTFLDMTYAKKKNYLPQPKSSSRSEIHKH